MFDRLIIYFCSIHRVRSYLLKTKERTVLFVCVPALNSCSVKYLSIFILNARDRRRCTNEKKGEKKTNPSFSLLEEKKMNIARTRVYASLINRMGSN